MNSFKTTSLQDSDKDVIEMHFAFIKFLSDESLKNGYRTIIGGGYAVDGNIGKITRPHNDIDIQIYGKDVMTPVLLAKKVLQEKFDHVTIQDKGRQAYYHVYAIPELGAEINYIRVATNPFSDTKIIVRKDGTFSAEYDFDTKIVVLQGVRFEAQSAVVELVDKLYKRNHRGDLPQPKHDQDMYNLQLITDKYEVDEALDKILKQMRED